MAVYNLRDKLGTFFVILLSLVDWVIGYYTTNVVRPISLNELAINTSQVIHRVNVLQRCMNGLKTCRTCV